MFWTKAAQRDAASAKESTLIAEHEQSAAVAESRAAQSGAAAGAVAARRQESARLRVEYQEQIQVLRNELAGRELFEEKLESEMSAAATQANEAARINAQQLEKMQETVLHKEQAERHAQSEASNWKSEATSTREDLRVARQRLSEAEAALLELKAKAITAPTPVLDRSESSRSEADAKKLRAASALLQQSAQELATEETLVSVLRQELDEATNHLKNHQQQRESGLVEAAEARRVRLEAEVVDLKQARDAAVAQAREYAASSEERTRVLLKTNVALESEVQQLKASVADYETDLHGRVSISAASTAMLQAQERAEAAEARLQDVENAHAATVSEVAALRSGFHDEQSATNEMVKALRNELSAAQSTHAAELTALASHIRDSESAAEARAKLLSNELQEAHAVHSHDEAMTLRWAKEIQAAEQATATAQALVSQRDAEIDTLKAVHAVTSRSRDERSDALEKEHTAAQAALQDAQVALESERRHLEAEQQKLSSARQELREALQELQNARAEGADQVREASAAAEKEASLLRRRLVAAENAAEQARQRAYDDDLQKRRELAAAVRAECLNQFERARQAHEDRVVRACVRACPPPVRPFFCGSNAIASYRPELG